MQIRDIFIEALQRTTPAERAAYLSEACGGDQSLRRQVEELLASHEREERFFLDNPLTGVTPSLAAYQPAYQPLGSQIGPYELQQVLGEGGMGVVYLAEQKEPLERKVALKVIKAGMDTRQTITRFEAERQALAMMDHPNIAKVFDAAASAAGRPYFVMEYVQGDPITKYCDEKRLRLEARLQLLIPVCQAIQHAHQKGIIHRDIKPSNVLVAEYDGRPVPKIIDFGVAKAVTAVPATDSAETSIGQILGTLEYMSPEQAELNPADIDTRTDIYSLGVLLYELLTGATPFGKDQLRKAGFREMLRMIREVEPLTPSLKLSTSNTLASVAAQREMEPARLTKTIRGELDWIVMKALEKDRNRRYESAAQFAADLDRYLNNDTVLACPPSAAYRLRKLIHRHKAAFTTAAVIALALVACAAVSTWQAVRAKRAESRALVHERNARTEKDNAVAAAAAERAAREAEAEQRRRAEEQTRVVEEQRQRLEENNRVSSMIIEQMLDAIRALPAKSADQHRLLTTALAGVTTLEPLDRLEAYARIAEKFKDINDLPSAVKAYEAAIAIAPADGNLQVGLGDMLYRSGKYQQAEAAFTRLIEQAVADPIAMERHLPYARRGFSRLKLKTIDQALTDFRASHDTWPDATMNFLRTRYAHHSASLLSFPNGYEGSRQLQTGLIELLDRHVAVSRRSAEALLLRADTLGYYGDFARVCDDCEAAIAARSPDHSAWYSLAITSLWRGDSVTCRRTARDMLRKFATPSSPDEASHTVLVCSLAPGLVDEYSEPIRLARWSLEQQPRGTTSLAWALVLLRQGQFDQARERLSSVMKHPDGSVVLGHYVLAILDHHQGRSEQARLQLARAEGYPNLAPYLAHWRYFLHLGLLKREAKRLIEPSSQ